MALTLAAETELQIIIAQKFLCVEQEEDALRYITTALSAQKYDWWVVDTPVCTYLCVQFTHIVHPIRETTVWDGSIRFTSDAARAFLLSLDAPVSHQNIPLLVTEDIVDMILENE